MKINKSQRKIYCIPYYRKAQYDRLRQISSDKETFPESYDEMFAITELKYRQLENKKFPIVKIDVDLDELVEWCKTRSVDLNPETRTKFALEKLKVMISSKVIDI